MSLSCAIYPKVKKQDGTLAKSKLFTDLLLAFPRNKAKEIYLKTKSNQFNNDLFELDELNEPTLKSLLEKSNVGKDINVKYLIDNLKKKYHIDTEYEYNQENIHFINKIILDFIKNSPFTNFFNIESLVKTNEDNKKLIVLQLNRSKNIKETQKESIRNAQYSEHLNNRLIQILEEHGITVGQLTNLEERLGISGVTDFSMLKKVSDGLIQLIRIAKGEKGQQALPEEFSHFAIEALYDNALIQRLLNLLYNNDKLVKEIIGDTYQEYSDKYEQDKYTLAKEAAAKLLSKHLTQQSIPEKPYKSLLSRVITAIKNFFSQFNENDIMNAQIEADKVASDLVKGILSETINEYDIEKISTSNKFYNLEKENDKDSQILAKIILNEKKRLAIYRKSNVENIEEWNKKQEVFIKELEKSLNRKQNIQGIFEFIKEALQKLNALEHKLDSLNSNSEEMFKTLRQIRNYYYSYKNMLDLINKRSLTEIKNEDSQWFSRGRMEIEQMSSLLDNIKAKYEIYAIPAFTKFFEPFVGKEIVIPFGDKKGKKITVEDLFNPEMPIEEISFFDRWLDSMADSSNFILKGFDQITKQAKGLARLRFVEVSKRISNAATKLEKAGITDTDWMFKRDPDGNLIGEYIMPISYKGFRSAKKEAFTKIKEKYSDPDTIKKQMAIWLRDNTVKDQEGKYIPNDKYKDPDFEAIKNNPAKYEYWKTMIALKKELDLMLPKSVTNVSRTIKIRKDLIERIRDKTDLKDKGISIWEGIKDAWIDRSDDTMTGEVTTLQDFEGYKFQYLPIYYTSLRTGESENDISTDVNSTMQAYALMALNFKYMSNVIDQLELGRSLLRDRRVQETNGNKGLVSKIKGVTEKVTKPQGTSNFQQRLETFFEMQVYERYIKNEGTFGDTKISKAKTADNINKLTALYSLALNFLNGISNVTTGNIMMHIEGIARRFFTNSDIVKADAIYGKELISYLGDIGSRVKKSKLALFDELFNVMQDYETEAKELDWYMKNRFRRLIDSNALFFFNNSGEHWMQNRTALALALNYKLKDRQGNEVNLWDAFEVVPINPNNLEAGNMLKLKEGLTKLDGTEFTDLDIEAFSRKSASINQHMHGIYNFEDRNALQNVGLGRMAILFRKWIKPSLNKRFDKVSYNYDLDDWTEGYYRTMGRFVLQMIKDVKSGQSDLANRWNELHPIERENIKRGGLELGIFLIVSLALGLIDWDDYEDSYTKSLIRYQLNRLATELGAMTPTHKMLEEGFTILKSPAAGIKTLETVTNLLKLVNPSSYYDENRFQSGRYKGKTRAYKYAVEAIPFVRTINRDLDPTEIAEFYERTF